MYSDVLLSSAVNDSTHQAPWNMQQILTNISKSKDRESILSIFPSFFYMLKYVNIKLAYKIL